MKKQEPKVTGPIPNKTEKVVAAISYIWLLSLLVIIFRKGEFERFHAKQGLVLAIIGFMFGIIAGIPLIGWLVSFVGMIAVILFAVAGLLHALQGEYFEMPIIGKYAKKLKL